MEVFRPYNMVLLAGQDLWYSDAWKYWVFQSGLIFVHVLFLCLFRENEKIRIRRLAKQVLHEWHIASQKSMKVAIERFAAAIGLHQGAGDANYNAEEEQGEITDMLEGRE